MTNALLAAAASLAALDVWVWAFHRAPEVMIAAMRVMP